MNVLQQLQHKLSGKTGDRIVYTVLVLLMIAQLIPQRFSYILSGVLVALWIAQGYASQLKSLFKTYPILWLFISMFVIHVVALFYTEDLRAGRIAVEKRLSLILFPIIIFSFKSLTTKQLNRLFAVFTYGWFLLGLYTLILALKHNYEVVGELNSKSYWLLSYRNLVKPLNLTTSNTALYMGFGMLWLSRYVLTCWTKLSKWSRAGHLSLLGFFFAYQVLLSSRTVLFAISALLYLGFLLWLILGKQIRNAVITAILIPGLMLGALYSNEVAWQRFADVFKFGQAREQTQFGGYQLRLEMWASVWEVVKDNPWLGTGTGDVWAEIVQAHEQRGFTEGVKMEYNAHNQYLQELASLGVLGLLILLANFLIPFYLAFCRRHYFYMGFIALLAFACITDLSLSFYKGIFFFAFINALLAQQLFAAELSNKTS